MNDAASFFSLFTHVLLAEHIVRNFSHLGECFDAMEASDEAILFEVARGTSITLYLRLNKKAARFVICPERPCHIEGFLRSEGHMAPWNGHSVSMHHLNRLIFMQTHVPCRK